jgi:hypothetical protein
MAIGTWKSMVGAAPTKVNVARPTVKILENISKLERGLIR